jgi:hypothetical protein
MTDTPEDDELTTVGHYFSAAAAHADRMALEEAGIDSCVLDETTASMYGVAIGARLQVRAADREAALAALQEPTVPGSALPQELAEPACPTCGSREVSQAAEIPEIPDESVDEWPSRVWRYRCGTCQHSWSADDDPKPGSTS